MTEKNAGNEAQADALRAAWDRGYATAVEGMKDIPARAWDEGYEAAKSDAFAASKGFTGYHVNPFRSDQ